MPETEQKQACVDGVPRRSGPLTRPQNHFVVLAALAQDFIAQVGSGTSPEEALLRMQEEAARFGINIVLSQTDTLELSQ